MEARLNSLINKNISLDGKSGRLIRWAMGDKTLKLTLDTMDIIILAEDANDSTDRIQTIEVPGLAHSAPVSLIHRSGSKIEELLMDNISKIQRDKEYLPQAREVNANIKSLIELAKTEIEYMATIASFGAQNNK